MEEHINKNKNKQNIKRRTVGPLCKIHIEFYIIRVHVCFIGPIVLSKHYDYGVHYVYIYIYIWRCFLIFTPRRNWTKPSSWWMLCFRSSYSSTDWNDSMHMLWQLLCSYRFPNLPNQTDIASH